MAYSDHLLQIWDCDSSCDYSSCNYTAFILNFLLQEAAIHFSVYCGNASHTFLASKIIYGFLFDLTWFWFLLHVNKKF